MTTPDGMLDLQAFLFYKAVKGALPFFVTGFLGFHWMLLTRLQPPFLCL